MIEEIWKEIDGYPNYKVSSMGNVKNYKSGRILKPTAKDGYLSVALYNANGRKYFFVHRLVACAFIPNPSDYPEVNHKDEIRSNNCLSNLEWCTSKYNANYGMHNAKISMANIGNKNHFYGKHHSVLTKEKMSNAKKGKPSNQRKKVIANGVIFDSLTDCAKYHEISLTQVFNLINHKRFSSDLKIEYYGGKSACMSA